MSAPSNVHMIYNTENKFADKNRIGKEFDEYIKLYGDDNKKVHESLAKDRKSNYTNMVNNFYDLVTDFYEYGWGDSFHFAQRYKGEAFRESIVRNEHFIGHMLSLRPGMKALDLGCGVGGPTREVARFTGASVVGINNNDYQIERAIKKTNTEGLSHLVSFQKGDFMKLPFPDNSFDAAFAFEATCHAPDKVGCYSEILRVLKPGGKFATYEWVVTKEYDPKNAEHKAIKEGIEVGNSLPELAVYHEIAEAFAKSGYTDIVDFDTHANMHRPNEIPWYHPLKGEMTVEGFRMSSWGRVVTHSFVSTLEYFKVAPSGSTKVSQLLNNAADDLVRGGQLEIFSPSYFVCGTKPHPK